MNFEILEKTFAFIQPQSKSFARSFYNKLFVVSPQLRPLFNRVNMEDQEKKLMYSLAMIVEGIRNMDSLKCIIKNLGQRHLSYQVIAEHYDIVGKVLLETLQEYLGSQWTVQAQRAWTEAYITIADLMLEGSKNEYLNNNKQVINTAGGGVRSILKQLRLQAITQKSIRTYNSKELVAQVLMQDDYIKDMKDKVGQEKTQEIIDKMLKKVEKKKLKK